MQGLVDNIDRIHTTPMGARRVQRNLGLQTDDVAAWCREAVKNADAVFGRGKNWYVYRDGAAITVNAHSYTVITAHRINPSVRLMRESDYPFLPEFLYRAIYIQ